MSDKVVEASGIPPLPDAPCAKPDALATPGGNLAPAAPYALVIDDDDKICRSVATILAELGVESASYLAARPAIASLDRRRPEIIFLDVALEQADAIDVMKWLSEKRYSGIVQLMSGGRLPLLEAVRRIGARNGLVVHPPLQKPVRADAIRAVIAGMGWQAPSPSRS